MPAITKVTCHCGTEFEARTADVKRGWGRFCSKSCAKTKTRKKRVAMPEPRCRECGDSVLHHGELCFHCEYMNEPQMGWDDHKH